MDATPVIGRRYHAVTTTRTEQKVVIEVTSVDAESDREWFVYGYRINSRNAGHRATMYPRLYAIAKG